MLNTGNVKHTVLQVRLRRSLYRDTLFAPGRKVSMGAHLYRLKWRCDTTTDTESVIEADIPRVRSHTPRIPRAGCAYPVAESSRGSLTIVGVL